LYQHHEASAQAFLSHSSVQDGHYVERGFNSTRDAWLDEVDEHDQVSFLWVVVCGVLSGGSIFFNGCCLGGQETLA
jgi:hypothetical protein